MRKLIVCLLFATASYGAELTSQEIFSRVRQKVAKQISATSNYTCIQTVDRSIHFDPRSRKAGCARSDPKGEKPFMHDRLRLDVAVSEGNEIFSWHGGSKFSSAGVNDIVKSGPISSGSFVGYLRNILFTPGVAIHLDRESSASNKSYEFTYFVPLRSSGYRILGRKGTFTVPYYGSFAAAADSFELRSLSVIAGDIPAGAEVCSADTEISYQSVNIAGKFLLLPKSFELHLADARSLDTLSRSEYRQCREFRGESTIRFDFDESAQAQSATAIHDQWIPAGTELHVRLKTVLNDQDSYTGDPVEGVLLDSVRVKDSEITVPKGAVLSGVVNRLELRYQPSRHYVVGIHFDRLTFGPNSMLLSANPKRVYTQEQRLGRGFANLPATATVDQFEGEPLFVLLSSRLRITQDFAAYWETIPPPKEQAEKLQ